MVDVDYSKNNQWYFWSGRTPGRKSSSFSPGRNLRMFVIKHFLYTDTLYSIAYLIPPKREHRTFNLIAPTHVLSAAMIASPQLSSRHNYSVPAVAPPLLALAHTTAICGLWNVLVCTLLPTVPRYFPQPHFPPSVASAIPMVPADMLCYGPAGFMAEEWEGRVVVGVRV